MSCQTCTHTMQEVAPELFWCPRCGTLKFQYAKGGDEWSEPKLVHRAFSLCESSLEILTDYEGYRRLHGPNDLCCGVGLEETERAVRECILPPEDR